MPPLNQLLIGIRTYRMSQNVGCKSPEKFLRSRDRHSQRAAPVLSLLLLIGSLALSLGASVRDQFNLNIAPQTSSQSHSQQFPRQARGSERCITCHEAEVDGYANSAMAHSLRPAGQEPQGSVSVPDGKITAFSSATGDWQRLEAAGEVTDYRINYVIGSGNHANGYLVNLGNHLFQSPLAYYRSRQTYDLAPGYENVRSPDFTRPVGEGCVFCHSGSALNVPGTLNQYRSPAFAAESISCERCHGPVEKHLADPRAGTIVNPAKLEPARRDSVCEQCHLFGVARVPNPGRSFNDFAAGQRLEDTFTVYRNTVPPGAAPGAFKVISHVEQLALSACARNSSGKLWCGTCHDPHAKPREAVEFYRSRCLTCHTSEFPASHPAKNTDCVSCHMPKRDARDGGHTAFTDHRIQRRPAPQSELPADTDIAAWREPAPELQKRNLGIAYIDAGVQRRSQSFVIHGYRALVEVQNQFPTDSELFSWIGQALLLGRQSSEAQLAFDRALQLNPDSPVNEGNAASARQQAGDITGAIAHLEKAVALDPLYLPAAGPLVGLYRSQGKDAEAAALSARIHDAMFPGPGGTTEMATEAAVVAPTRPAGDVFKNIQLFKETPADRILPTMQFMSSALGVNCVFCHVPGHFEKDDKKPKQTARKMIRMTLAINKTSFDNLREVTCFSCHRGVHIPAADPAVETGDRPLLPTGTAEASELPDQSPSATQILDAYVAALGGAAAIEQVTSRIEEGVITTNGASAPLDVISGESGKQAIIRHLANGDSSTFFDGQSAWFTGPDRPARRLEGDELEAARQDADLHFAINIRKIFPELRVEYPEVVNGQATYTLVGVREGHPKTKLYFDKRSGLLVRLERYADSPLGLHPSRIDYADYREVNGVQLPFRRRLSGPTGTSTIELKQIRQNVPIPPKSFASNNK
jgi:photosynthetic reaction center cytochrome c subunit